MFLRTTAQVLENKEDYKVIGLVSSQASRGLGLWTAICLGFANFFGTRCNSYAWKIEKAKDEALEDIIEEASEKGADGIVDIRFSISGLSVIASGTAVRVAGIKKE